MGNIIIHWFEDIFFSWVKDDLKHKGSNYFSWPWIVENKGGHRKDQMVVTRAEYSHQFIAQQTQIMLKNQNLYDFTQNTKFLKKTKNISSLLHHCIIMCYFYYNSQLRYTVFLFSALAYNTAQMESKTRIT